jgi:hypothetical protein
MLASDGIIAFCLSTTHHSHFKLLKTMKKLFFASGLTPSVFKGIYACVFLIFTTTLSFSQNSKWEFGVGLRPLTLKEEPYSLMVKRFLSRGVAVRFGFGALYSEKESHHSDYHYNSFVEDYIFNYEYTQIDKNLYTSAFLGIQYGKRKNNFYWYGATDFSFRYTAEIASSPNGITVKYQNLQPGDYLKIPNQLQDKNSVIGIRQNIGIQYYFNTNVSVSLEGGIYFEQKLLKRLQCSGYSGRPVLFDRFVFAYNCPDGLEESYQFNQLGISPLSMLTFYYHF